MPRAKRGFTDLSGIIAIDKDSGMTSHDVVARLRNWTGEGRIGHAGTLDPMATGLLFVCIGSHARLADKIMQGNKTYAARIAFGAATDTDDAQGQVVARADICASLGDKDFAQSILAKFLGEQMQMPPDFSAIKKDGQKAYKLARQGIRPKLEARAICVHGLRLTNVGKDFWDIEAEVSKGTYIRSLARDIGEAAGTKAHLSALRRTRSSGFDVNRALKLHKLEAVYTQIQRTSEKLAQQNFGYYLQGQFLDPLSDLNIAAGDIPKSLRGSVAPTKAQERERACDN